MPKALPKHSLYFGEVDALLSQMHSIADNRRTAFQARLKNFHRLGYPDTFRSSKGRAAEYSLGHLVEMALAIELTQLGLPPERTCLVLTVNWYPALIAISMAASTLTQYPDGYNFVDGIEPDDMRSMFIYFDPAALDPPLKRRLPPPHDDDEASQTFSFAGAAVVREQLVEWTKGAVPRLALCNITAMLDRLAWRLHSGPSAANERQQFHRKIADWANVRIGEKFILSMRDDVRDRLEHGGWPEPNDQEFGVFVEEISARWSITLEEARTLSLEILSNRETA